METWPDWKYVKTLAGVSIPNIPFLDFVTSGWKHLNLYLVSVEEFHYHY